MTWRILSGAAGVLVAMIGLAFGAEGWRYVKSDNFLALMGIVGAAACAIAAINCFNEADR